MSFETDKQTLSDLNYRENIKTIPFTACSWVV